MFQYIRPILGKTLILLDQLTSPESLQRPPEEQARTNQQTQKLSLYQFAGCPFCIKVRRAMKRLNLNIELRNADQNPVFKNDLIQQGGTYQTPCLRIEKEDGSVQWLYESSDIISYLEKQFSPSALKKN
jgi:glutaredoxin